MYPVKKGVFENGSLQSCQQLINAIAANVD